MPAQTVSILLPHNHLLTQLLAFARYPLRTLLDNDDHAILQGLLTQH